MKNLYIIKGKPNPTGKDRYRNFSPPKQLAAEWVNFKNNGTEAYPLSEISLQHIAYQPGCRNGDWDKVMGFQGELGREQVVRVHSGEKIPLTDMSPEDARGADHHLFTGRNYVWNNDCGDSPGLWDGRVWIDKASYDPYPPEGIILRRVGDKLIP